MSLFVWVVFPLPLEQAFLYGVPERLELFVRPGTRVTAPLGAKTVTGFIVGVTAEAPAAGIRTKDILGVLDRAPFWSERFLDFTGRLSREFRSSWGEMLQAALRPSLAVRSKAAVVITEAGGRSLAAKKGLGPKERALLALLAGKAKGLSPLFLQRKTGSRDVAALLTRLEKKGCVLVKRRTTPVRPGRTAVGPGPNSLQLRLDFPGAGRGENPLSPVERALEGGRFDAFLLFGSQSRLDAAYAALIRRASACGPGKTLFLVPEVGRTPEFPAASDRGPGGPAAVFHSRMTEKQKDAAWSAVRSGKASLVAGTRSALFVDPGPLRFVIVDGEQEESYRQAESPAYDARRGAWLRARVERAVVLFGSSRPSVEAFYEASRGGRLIELGREPARRRVSVVEHKGAGGAILSGELERKIRASLAAGGPVILFLNRRGYAAGVACAACGHIPRCRRCDIPMVYHKNGDVLVCHYCNASAHPVCQACGGRLALRQGAGTQALEEDVRRLFPGISAARFDADTASGREERERLLDGFAKGRTAVLIGTQMLAYQSGLPKARLVGILSPETLLGFSDYGAAQKTYQTVAAMMESAGEGPEDEVVVQTSATDHFAIRAAAAGDYRAFYDREIEFRRVMNYPPHAALAEVTLLGRDVRALAARAREFKTRLERLELRPEILGPAFAAVGRIKDLSRIQVVLKAPSREILDRALDKTMPAIRLKKSIVFSYSPFREDQPA